MREFTIFVEGRPLAQQRPRTFQVGGKTRTISNKGANKAWQNTIRDQVRRAWLEQGNPEPMSEVEADISFLLSNQKKALWDTPHTSRPDIDNLVKLVMDALQPIKGDTLWKGAVSDDGQIWKLKTQKTYTFPDNQGVWINLKGR